MDIFIDMVRSYKKYHIWSSQYTKEDYYILPESERIRLGNEYKEINDLRDNWIRDKNANVRFIEKWTKRTWEFSDRRISKRYHAYSKRYNISEGGAISSNVILERNHFLNGTIKIGKNVLLSKNVYIDYSGEVVIDDNVKIANGVIIESHHRDIDAFDRGDDVNIPTKLIIQNNAYIGSRSIILDSCNYIGKFARIGAGAVVTKDVPDYAVVVGVPAKVVRYVNLPESVVE